MEELIKRRFEVCDLAIQTGMSRAADCIDDRQPHQFPFPIFCRGIDTLECLERAAIVRLTYKTLNWRLFFELLERRGVMYQSMFQQRSRLLSSGLSVCLLVAAGVGCSANNGNNNSTSASSCGPAAATPFVTPQGAPVITGGFAYAVKTTSHKILWYKVESSGALTSRGEICAGSQPTFIATHSTRKLAYVTNYSSNTVSAYTIGTDGALASLSSPVPAGAGPASLTVDSTRNLVYVANFDSDSVSVYEIESNGTLTRVQDLQTGGSGSGPVAIELDTTGNFVYVSHFKVDTLSAYKVNTTTRRLETTPIETYNQGLRGSNAIAIHPTQPFIYLTNEDNATVSAFRIDTITGKLTLIGSPFSIATGAGPEGVAVDPSGNFLYVTDGQGDTVSMYTINTGTGELTPRSPRAIGAGGDPEGITVDPTGKFAYVVHRDTSNIFVYTINPGGALAFLSSIPL